MRARRWWGWPLVPVYAVGLAVKDGLRRMGVLRVRRLVWPVISVGSLSAGGAGKTPVVIALAELLTARGWYVDVLTRGYGRDSSDGGGKDFGVRVEPDIDDAATRYGDEPTLIARKTRVPVWVGVDRFSAGKCAEDFAAQETWDIVSETAVEIKAADPARGVHLLDDGFQHRRLGRAMDVVLVTAGDLEDALLPAGNRREGLRALGRADVVVVREEELAAIEGGVGRWMRGDARIWVVRRRLRFGGVSVGEHTPGAKAPSSGAGERPEAEASGYLEAEATAKTKAMEEAREKTKAMEEAREKTKATEEGRAETKATEEATVKTKATEEASAEAKATEEAREKTKATEEARAEAKATEEARAEAKAGARAGERVVGFCGIARPAGFWGMLAGAGCEVEKTVEFGDHHRYAMVDVERVVTVARECGAVGFVTTEKDAVKLTTAMRERLQAVGRVVIARLDVTFLDEAAVVRDVESKIGEGWLG